MKMKKIYRFLLLSICFICSINIVHGQTNFNKARLNKTNLPANFRFIYNSDGLNIFADIATPITPEKVYAYVDEAARAGVTSFFISPNVGMLMNYPTKVGDMIGENVSPELNMTIVPDTKSGLIKGILNLRELLKNEHDPLGLILKQAKDQKMEAFISFRPNEVHAVEQKDNLLLSRFWKQHPEWRIGNYNDSVARVYHDIMGPRTSPIVTGWLSAGLNFAIPEVRTYQLAMLREICERYNIDGLEIDFQRFPMYFKPGEETRNVETMTQWIRDIKKMVNAVGRTKKHPIMLTARIMADPQQNIAIGLDPATWAKKKLVDFVIVSHYLHNNFPLPISEYRKIFPESYPIYASVEVASDIATYRTIAGQLWKSQINGISLFNFFTTRERGAQPPFDLIHQIGYPAMLDSVKRSEMKNQDTDPILLVANKHSSTLSFINPRDLEVIATIPTGPNPHEIAVTPDQRYAYLSSYQPPGNTISVIDLVNRKQIKTIQTGQYTRIHGTAMAPDGKNAYFTAGQSGFVVEIDTKTNEITRSIPTYGKISHMVYVSRDGLRLYTANIGTENVSVIDRKTGNLIAQIPCGGGSEGMSFTPDDKYLWVGNQTAGTITVVDLATYKPIETFPCKGMPVRIKFTNDGKFALVPGWVKDGTLTVIDVASRKELKRIKVGSYAIGIELSPDERFAFVGCEDSLEAQIMPDGSERVKVNTKDSDGIHVIDMKTLSVVAKIKSGLGPDPMVMWYPPK